MADKATDPQLKQGFMTHLDETQVHVQRLEQVFKMHGAEVKSVNCPAIDGIIKEADETAGEVDDKAVLDAALINAAQAAEHYEIVRYGSLIAWAKQLGRNDCAAVLQKTLDEEKATDKKLTTLAESKINLRAASRSIDVVETKSRAGQPARFLMERRSADRDYAFRNAKWAPQNAIMPPRHRAARPARTPAMVGTGLGAEAAWPAPASTSTPTAIRNWRMRCGIRPDTALCISVAVR